MASARWLLKPDPGPAAEEIAAEFGLSRVMAAVVAGRVQPPTPDRVRAFLRPSLVSLAAPWSMDDMDRAADRLAAAIRSRQRVIVYGDYDTDGVTACALLIRACRAAGHSLDYRLPSRFEEGYGISPRFPEQAAAEGVSLVVTVDCGTSEGDKIDVLAQNGIDVIVTDHHEPGERGLPASAYAVLNPKRSGSSYPFRELTGVGVAFKLAWAVYERLSGAPRVEPRLRETLLSLLPLAAIGTIADVAPLVDENRAIVHHGLRRMRDSVPGVTALLEMCRQGAGAPTARSVAFSLSPRLNAAGRMGSADLSLELLTEDDPAKARLLAERLDRQNSERQALCQVILDEAVAEAGKDGDPDAAALLVAREGWHEGVIGIVAGRLSEMFAKPAAVVSFPVGQDRGRGSARSIEGVNLYQAMSRAGGSLLTFGGHELAAGFSVTREALGDFRRAFLRECESQIRRKNLAPSLAIDAEIRLADLAPRLIEEMDLLRPLGQGNPEPQFLIRGVRAAGGPQLMGARRRHFHFNVSQGGISYRAVVFNNLGLLPVVEDAAGRLLDLVCTPILNSYYSPPRLELRVGDLRPGNPGAAHSAGREPGQP